MTRSAQSATERLLADHGWMLPESAEWSIQKAGAVEVIVAFGAFGGQCRPFRMQAFVFLGGVFAGTLSPRLMDARWDGCLRDFTVEESGRIDARFIRQVKGDPMCCPSRESSARYVIDRDGKGPVVRFLGAEARPSR
jgi:hypothetical protein